jgi:N-acetylglucosamine kinase-like BadF-type ATPase
MRYRMGIDSGGSKTLGILEARRDDGQATRWQAQVGNTNHHSCTPDVAQHRIARLIAMLCREGGIEPGDLDGICFAGAGIDSEADTQLVTGWLREIGCGGRLLVCSDALAALAGANGTLSGGMVLSGTGSIALGIDREGAVVRVGGWGYKLDDAGSGYGTAILGLRAAYEAVDGRGRPTAIGAAMWGAVGVADMHALLDWFYAPECTPDRIARLARCVSDLAGSDAMADEILDRAADALAGLAVTLVARMGLEEVSLGLCGGMLQNIKPLSDRVLHRLAQEPHIGAHLPRYSAAEGALILLDACEEDDSWAMPSSI